MNKSAKGRRRENQACDLLESWGYLCNMPNKKHLFQEDTGRVGYTDFFGLWDIIAVSGKRIRFVQVKSNKNANKEWYERARSWQCPKDCSKEVWIFKDRVKDPKIILL